MSIVSMADYRPDLRSPALVVAALACAVLCLLLACTAIARLGEVTVAALNAEREADVLRLALGVVQSVRQEDQSAAS